MDTVAVTIPLELICPECENVGVNLRTELPARLTTILNTEDGQVTVLAEDVLAPTRISCPTCGRSVSFGPLKADVTDPAIAPENVDVPTTGGS